MWPYVRTYGTGRAMRKMESGKKDVLSFHDGLGNSMFESGVVRCGSRNETCSISVTTNFSLQFTQKGVGRLN